MVSEPLTVMDFRPKTAPEKILNNPKPATSRMYKILRFILNSSSFLKV